MITTNCREKKTLETFNDISQLIVHCAVMPSAANLSAVQLHHLQLEANEIGPQMGIYLLRTDHLGAYNYIYRYKVLL